jgi:endonuclease III
VVVQEIVALVLATDADDHTFEQPAGPLVARFDALRDALAGGVSAAEDVVPMAQRAQAICTMAQQIGEQHRKGIEQDSINDRYEVAADELG